jgi:predicted ATPase
MATQLLLSGMGRQFSSQADLIGFLSTAIGQQNHSNLRQALEDAVSEIRAGTRRVALVLQIAPKTGQVTSPDQLSSTMIGFLDRRLPPSKTIFSYFPADRAIPSQEQPVQIGPADANNQLESHNSQPQLKYSRLKNTIFNSVVSGRDAEQKEQFKAIFSRILRGRSLVEVKVSDRGMLRIDVQDDEKARTFAIEAMSSGEKGLILTCLLIAQTIEKGGIVLLDEPDLHLNPAVCKEVLSFLIEEYANPHDLQLVICSHSPEILGVAFDRDDCELYHLVSGEELAPVRKQDLEEVGKALKRLGASQAEGLLYRGTVFVEGEDDEDILQGGFKSIFQRYVIRELGGRKNIEKEVKFLQAQEKRSKNPLRTAFILDNDGDPTPMKSSANVRVLQWDRRCLENYLLDFDALTDLAKDSSLATKPVTNVAALKKVLKRLAMSQIDEIAFWNVYNGLPFGDLALRQKEVQGKKYPELAKLVAGRIRSLKNKLGPAPDDPWESNFVGTCDRAAKELRSAWENDWSKVCDGKRLIRDLHAEIGFKESLPRMKVRVIVAMEATRTSVWSELDGKLRALLG